MGLWDDLYRGGPVQLDESFEDVGGVQAASTASGGGSDAKEGAPRPTRKLKAEESEVSSGSSDKFARSKDEGLRGGSRGSLGDGDASVTAQHQAQDAQRKMQSSPTEYNGSVSTILNTPQAPPKIEDNADLDYGQIAGALSNYNTNWVA